MFAWNQRIFPSDACAIWESFLVPKKDSKSLVVNNFIIAIAISIGGSLCLLQFFKDGLAFCNYKKWKVIVKNGFS